MQFWLILIKLTKAAKNLVCEHFAKSDKTLHCQKSWNFSQKISFIFERKTIDILDLKSFWKRSLKNLHGEYIDRWKLTEQKNTV